MAEVKQAVAKAPAQVSAAVKAVVEEAEEKPVRRAVYFLGLPEELDDMISSMVESGQAKSRPAAFQQVFGFDVSKYDRKSCLENNVKYQLAEIEALKARIQAGQAELVKLKA
jgi:hypothetical protein